MRKVQLALLLGLVMVVFSAATLVHAQDTVTINYVLWDTNQLPPYQQCADKFQQENPGITINIQQQGWNDYWTGITTGFVSGTAPDVFTDHLAKYPEFVNEEQLVDLQPLIDRDSLATDIYYPGLADLWVKDGKRYGLPKDWDTIAIAYNKNLLTTAGIDPATMATDQWTWNPDDGGSFGHAIAQLSLDKAGHNGLDPAFDMANVTQYGFLSSGSGGANGQTQWSALAASTGWTFTNGVWGDHYNYDDPKFIATIQWWDDVWLKHGFGPPLDQQTSLGQLVLFQTGNVAMTFIGSWQVGDFVGSNFPVGFGRLPIGPVGRRSMFNGLADSIWVGTQHLEESWKWVKFLSSAECEDIVGDSGVVFPAIPEAAQRTLASRAAKNIDMSAFLDQANQPDGTFLFPITDHGSDINTIMNEAMDNIALGTTDAATALPAAATEVNALFSQ